MAASTDDEFRSLLSKKLTDVNADVDLEIFLSYIIGILETDSPREEKEESLEGILSELSEDADQALLCDDIIKMWDKVQPEQPSSSPKSISIENTMHNLVEQQVSKATRSRVISEDVKERKAAILAQYAHVSDGEETDEDEHEEQSIRSEELLSRNMNAVSVHNREVSERERMKEEHDTKKQRDKEEREKQKQKAADRKESEKKRTQKGERRR